MKQINLFFSGDYYLGSTTNAKSLREAVIKYIQALEDKAHSLGGLTFLEEYVYKHKSAITAKYAKAVQHEN